jgi:dienelactone hydrolase
MLQKVSLPFIGLLAFCPLSATAAFAAGCLSQEITFSEGDFHVNVSRVIPNKATERAVIILPPTGGTNLIDRSYARRLCRAGFDVYILNHWSGDGETDIHLDLHQKLYTRALQATRIALAHIPGRYVGVLGTSVGALFAEVAAGSLARIDAVMVIVGGAPIPRIIVNSAQRAMIQLRKDRYELYKFTDDREYLTRLTQAFQLDPFELDHKFEKMDLAMVIAEDDIVVPTADQHSLKDFWRPQKVISLRNGHFWAIVKTWLFHSREVVGFFKNSADVRMKAGAKSKTGG